MSEAVLEPAASQGGQELEISDREEESRLKFAELRDGLRQLLQKRGLPLDAGVSSSDLVAILSQAVGSSNASKYTERLDTDWREEYRRLVQGIGVLTGSHSDTETDPRAVIDSVERRMAAAV